MEKTLAELKEQLDHAYWMASIGRDPTWLRVIYNLDRQIKEMENE